MDDRPDVDGPPRRGPSRGQVIALVVALCFLSGAVGWAIAQPSHSSFNDVDSGFLGDMTTHHLGAIDLGFDYLRVQHDPVVAHFAREIILTQTQEITLMNGLRDKAVGDAPASDVVMAWMGEPTPVEDMPGMPDDAQLAALAAASGASADEQFTELMIRHHAAGVAMADYAAGHGHNDKVVGLARTMARQQRAEINELNARRRILGLSEIDARELERAHAH